MQPIRPEDVQEVKNQTIPSAVIKAFNDLILKNLAGGRATFTQNAVVEAILQEAGDSIKKESLFDNHWLDVEPLYRTLGWKVTFDKPGYNETYPATFTFSTNKKQEQL